MSIRTRALLQTLIFLIVMGATLFGSAGRLNIPTFWLYLAIIAVVSILALVILDPDLMQERMRPGGQNVRARFLPAIALLFLHWAVAGFDRGRLHISDNIPGLLRITALVLFALSWLVFLWAMHVNRFFSSIPRIQFERGHQVINAGPYRFVRHPGYTAASLAAATSGIALCSWLSTFIAPVAIALLVRRTIIEDRLLQSELPGYADYASQVRYRLIPGLW